jgi:hypothetical protein
MKHTTLTTKPSQSSSTTHTLHNHRSAGAVLFSWDPYGKGKRRGTELQPKRGAEQETRHQKAFVVCCLRDSLLFASLSPLCQYNPPVYLLREERLLFSCVCVFRPCACLCVLLATPSLRDKIFRLQYGSLFHSLEEGS